MAPTTPPAGFQSSFFDVPVGDKFPTTTSSIPSGRTKPLHAPESPGITVSNSGEWTPYLCLPALLSQVWLNKYSILLCLLLVRIAFAGKGVQKDLQRAGNEYGALSLEAKNAANSLLSTPKYMAGVANELIALGIQGSVNALESLLVMSILALGEIILFFINLLTQTYVCLLTMAIRGSLETVIAATEDVTKFLNNTLHEIETGITNDVANLNKALGKARNDLSGVGGFFGSTASIPNASIPSADSLRNISIPTDVAEKLQSLNDSIPTFAQVHNATNEAILLPFQLLSVSSQMSPLNLE